jgi:hypothetical protein
MPAYSLKLFSPSRHRPADRALQGVTAYAGSATALGRCGASWYGLVSDNTPLLAFFVDDGWYKPALSFGLAVGPFELGLFLSFRSSTDSHAGSPGGVAP